MESITAKAIELDTQPAALLWADKAPVSMAPCGWKGGLIEGVAG